MIHIIDDWYMTADRYCYTVGRLSKRKKSRSEETEDFLNNATYHATIAHALQSVLQDTVRDKIAKDKVATLAEVFELIEKYNLKLIKQFDKAERALLAERRPIRKAL